MPTTDRPSPDTAVDEPVPTAPPASLPRRIGRAAAHPFTSEWRRLAVRPRQVWPVEGIRSIWFTIASTVAVVVLWYVTQTSSGLHAVKTVGGVSADISVGLELVRMPVSLFVSAPNLTPWGGLPRLLFAFGVAELTIGRTRLLVVAYATTLIGTLGARIMIAMGPHAPWGLGPDSRQVLDTGYSAAAVGLVVYVAIVHRAPIVFLIGGAPIVYQILTKWNMAAREHALAIITATLLAVLWPMRTDKRTDNSDAIAKPDKATRVRISPQSHVKAK